MLSWWMLYGAMYTARDHLLREAVLHVHPGVLHAATLETVQPPQIKVCILLYQIILVQPTLKPG